MIFIWKGWGGLFLLSILLAAGVMMGIERFVPPAAHNQDLLEMACIAGLSAIFTLLIAGWLEKRDRSKDETLDVRSARAMHTLYWIPLLTWGYVAAIAGTGLLVLAFIPGFTL